MKFLKNRQEILVYLIVSIVFPFWSFLLSRFFSNKFFKSVTFIIFSTYLGTFFIHGDLSSRFEGGDNVRYILDFQDFLVNFGGDNFVIVRSNFWSENSYPDFLFVFVMYVLSLFTQNPDSLYIAFHIIYAILFLKLYNILSFERKSTSLSRKFLFTLLFFIIPIWFVNSFRFWTGSLVFVIALLEYSRGKSHCIWYFLLALLTHFVMILPFVIFVILYFADKLSFKWAGLFLLAPIILFVTTFYSFNVADLVTNDSIVADRVKTYGSLDYINFLKTEQHYGFLFKLSEFSMKFIFSLLFLYLLFRLKNIPRKDLIILNLIGVLVIIAYFAPVADIQRFYTTCFLFVVAFMLYRDIKIKSNVFALIFTPACFFIIFRLRMSLDHYGLEVFNPLFIRLGNNSIPMIELLK